MESEAELVRQFLQWQLGSTLSAREEKKLITYFFKWKEHNEQQQIESAFKKWVSANG